VISTPGDVYILVFHRFARNIAHRFKGFEYGDRISSASAEIIDLCYARRRDETINKSCNVLTMNVITNLFSFVAKDPISSLFNVAIYQITQEAMELYPAVIWSGQAPAAQAACGHSEVPSIFLHHDVGSHL